MGSRTLRARWGRNGRRRGRHAPEEKVWGGPWALGHRPNGGTGSIHVAALSTVLETLGPDDGGGVDGPTLRACVVVPCRARQVLFTRQRAKRQRPGAGRLDSGPSKPRLGGCVLWRSQGGECLVCLDSQGVRASSQAPPKRPVFFFWSAWNLTLSRWRVMALPGASGQPVDSAVVSGRWPKISGPWGGAPKMGRRI